MSNFLKTALGRLRIIAFAEGISYLILLFVAMPMKHIWGQPNAVRSFGTVHGLLFVLYILYLILCKIEHRWTTNKVLILLGISIIPFGNFYADKHYLQTQDK
jgi:integral membrane protein